MSEGNIAADQLRLFIKRIERLYGPEHRCKPCNNAGHWHCNDPIHCGFMMLVHKDGTEEHLPEYLKARGL